MYRALSIDDLRAIATEGQLELILRTDGALTVTFDRLGHDHPAGAAEALLSPSPPGPPLAEGAASTADLLPGVREVELRGRSGFRAALPLGAFLGMAPLILPVRAQLQAAAGAGRDLEVMPLVAGRYAARFPPGITIAGQAFATAPPIELEVVQDGRPRRVLVGAVPKAAHDLHVFVLRT